MSFRKVHFAENGKMGAVGIRPLAHCGARLNVLEESFFFRETVRRASSFVCKTCLRILERRERAEARRVVAKSRRGR